MDDEKKNPLQDFFLGKEEKEMEEEPTYYSEIERRGKLDENKENKDIGETPYSQGYFSELDRTGEQSLDSDEESNSTREGSQNDLFKDDDFEE